MKPLLPTLKERKRYLAYEVQTERACASDFSKPLITKLQAMLGLFGSAEAGFQSISYDRKTQEGLLRVSLKGLPATRKALLLVTELNDTPVRIKTLGVTGIIKKTERFTTNKLTSTKKTK